MRTHEQFIVDVEKRNTLFPNFKIKIKKGSQYSSLDSLMVFHCCNGHPDFSTRPRYIIHKKSGCPLCKDQKSSASNSKGLTQFALEISKVVPNISIHPKDQQYINTNTKMQFLCLCGYAFSATPKSLLHNFECVNCKNQPLNKISSKFVISPVLIREFDALVKSIPNTIIELIPINQPYDKYFYSKRMAEATKQTIFIFEDEWKNNKELIKSKLLHYSKTNIASTIHARQCSIKQITNADKKPLLDNHHVQGNDNAPLSYGAFYNNELVAVMTFSVPRLAVGAKSKNRAEYTDIWELSRFCTNTNYRIPGIAGKLLKHFQRNNKWKEIYSFADKRWSVGSLYYALGFTLIADNSPSYFYVINGVRKHRWNYRKDILKNTLPNYDSTLTEYQNMENHGYWRVWDCGTLKFSMVKP